MKQFFPDFCRNDNLKERLAEEISGGRFPHAYIIAGEKGSGKRTLALNVASALACEDENCVPCGKCDNCQKIFNGYSPDVIHIRKDSDKKEFTVNLIREIKDGLYIAPNELEKRVYIIEDAETMNINAQNAFLKMLEEPPSYVVFLLLCSNVENLLETIKSRAPILYTERLPFDDVKSLVIAKSAKAKDLSENSPDNFSNIITSANGSVGKAISLCEESDKHIKLRNMVLDFLKAWTAPSLLELNLFCDSMPTNSDEFENFLFELTFALRDVALASCDQN